MKASKTLFLCLVVATVISNVSLQKICSEVKSKQEKNECRDLCTRSHGKLTCKLSGQDEVCECFHNISKRHPFCPEPTTDACKEACGPEPFECRIVSHKGACYCTGLGHPINPLCPTDEYRECRISCDQVNSSGVCIRVRGETSVCKCTKRPENNDSSGPHRRFGRYH